MLLRLCLIVAVVTGLAGVGLVHTKLKEKITGLNTDISNLTTERSQLSDNLGKAKTAERKAKEERDEANKQLSTATNDLIMMTAKATEQEKRANDNSAKLAVATKERNDAQAQLAAWSVLGLTPSQVDELKTQLKDTVAERDAIAAEKEILTRDNKRLMVRLDRYEGDKDKKVVLPTGLKGKILAVDPKWSFVVLDIGADQGVLERGEMLVSRNGQLVAKVRISSVETNRSIANVLPEWKQSDLVEGDQVLY